MSKLTKHALTVLADPALHAKDTEIDTLKDACVQQFAAVAKMESRAARGGVICGLTLHRVKASLPRGEFRLYLEQMLPKVTFWSGATAVKNASFYMRLASIFIEKARIQKPDILALPGDPLSLDLGDNHSAQRFMSKLDEFAGNLSLNELLIKHGIKGVGLKTALDAEAEDETGAPTPGAAEDYFADVAERIYGFRQIVTNRESLLRLTPQQLDTLDQTVSETYGEFKRLLGETRQGGSITV